MNPGLFRYAAALLIVAAPPAAVAASPALDLPAKAGPAMFAASGATGLVLVVVTPVSTSISGFGQDAPGSGKPPGAYSLMRISSTSKLLTADVALKLAANGKVRLDDSLQRHALRGSIVPVLPGSRAITLQDLATHTSGLPRQVDSATGAQERWQWLSSFKPTVAPGPQALYSNLGFDLLADALAQAGAKPYTALLREQTTGPLNMHDTTATPTAAQCARLLHGAQEVVKCVDLTASAGTGGMYSTPEDMGAWMSYMLGLNPDHKPDPRALQIMVETAALKSAEGLGYGGPAHGIGLGWIHLAPSDSAPAILQKTGASAGFMSYMSIAPSAQVGVFAVATRFDLPAMAAMVKQVNALTVALAVRKR